MPEFLEAPRPFPYTRPQIHPRGETPRSGERRDTVWGKYVVGDPTGSKWSPAGRPLPERASISEIQTGTQ